MKTYLAVLLGTSLACGSWIVGNARQHRNAPRFQDKPLSYWARVLTEHPVRRRTEFQALGPDIVPYLVKEIEQYEPYRRDPLYQLYAAFYWKAPILIKSHVPEPISRQERALNAIKLLGELGPEARGAVAAVTLLLEDELLCAAVVTTLGRIGPAAKDAVPKLIELLEEPHAWVATTLGQIGPEAKDAIPALTGMLTNGQFYFRREARDALNQIDPVQFATNDANLLEW